MNNSNLIRSEKGMVLVFVTMTLALAMLIIGPTLGFIGGAGRSAQIREDRMTQLYAADIGIEDGYFRIANSTYELPDSHEDEPLILTIEDVNDCDVDIEIYKEPPDPVREDALYKVISTATHYTGVVTTIESYVTTWNYGSILGYALISCEDVEVSSGGVVFGDVALNGTLDNKGTITGEVTYGVPGWPSVEELSSRYDSQVLGVCGPNPIQVKADKEKALGPCKTNGNQEIRGIGNVTLQGTVYIAGDLEFNPSPSLIIKLNGETIYAEGSINMGPGCTVIGPGCIIAAGDMYFGPQIGNTAYILAMSVAGDLRAQPSGNFYGTMAAGSGIDLQPNSTIDWVDHPYDINFPTGDEGDTLPNIVSYIIK